MSDSRKCSTTTSQKKNCTTKCHIRCSDRLRFFTAHTRATPGAVVFGQSSHVPALLCTLIHYNIVHIYIYIYIGIDISKHALYSYYV